MVKAHENVRMEWLRMIKGIKWAKKAQNDIRINPVENTRQHELNKRKVHGRPKRGLTSIS